MALHDVGEIPSLFSVNIGASAGIGFIDPLLLQFDLSLNFLGGLQAEIAAQFAASLAATVQLGISISNPLAAIFAALSAIASLQASLSAALALGLPTVSVQLSAQLAAAASLTAQLSVKLGLIRLLLEAALRVKLPALKFFADLSLALDAGPIHVLSFDQTPGLFRLVDAGAAIDSLFSVGLSGISPIDPVYGVLIVTKEPSAWVGIQATLLTG